MLPDGEPHWACSVRASGAMSWAHEFDLATDCLKSMGGEQTRADLFWPVCVWPLWGSPETQTSDDSILFESPAPGALDPFPGKGPSS